MSNREELMLIRMTVGGAEAVTLVNAIAGTDAARVERRVYYPYFWFSAACAARTLFGKKPLSATCLVDGCNGLGATADRFAADEVIVPAAAILTPRTHTSQASQSAQRFLTHNLSRRLKTIGHFAVSLQSHGLVYKAFWLVRCSDTVVMVDSVTAAMHTLSTRILQSLSKTNSSDA